MFLNKKKKSKICILESMVPIMVSGFVLTKASAPITLDYEENVIVKTSFLLHY